MLPSGRLAVTEASMMAEETSGPMKADVLPMMLKIEKKRNTWPRGGYFIV